MKRWLLMLFLATGCATSSPRQLGGLAMFNPRGVEVRVALRQASENSQRVKGVAANKNGTLTLSAKRDVSEVGQVTEK